jgi:ABC-type branched-subunit amino acid transport system substrate-binding protein
VTATPSPWDKKYAIQRDYHTAMVAAGITNYSYLSFEAYINARVAIEAIKRSKNRSQAALRVALDTQVFSFDNLEWRFGALAGGRFTDLSLLRSDGTFMH